MSKRAAIWKKRVVSWRASEKTAKTFSTGREWSAGTLLWWSSRLRHEMPAPVVRVAHLIRSSADRTRGGGAIVALAVERRAIAVLAHEHVDHERVTVLAPL